MKHTRKIKLCTGIIAVCCIYYSANAQSKFPKAGQPWSMRQCINYAMENNIQIKQNELNENSSSASLLQSKAAVLPSINGSASHSYNFGQRIDPFTNQFANSEVLSENLSISGNVTLFKGLQNYNTIKENQYNYMASKYDVDKNKNDISLQVATDYLQILLDKELLESARGQLDVSNKQVIQTQKTVEAGTVAKGNLLNIESQQAADQLNVINAKNALDLAYLDLQQLLDLDSIKDFQIVQPQLDLPGASLLEGDSVNQIYKVALATQPDVKSAQYKLQGANKAVSVAKGGISPQLSLFAAYGTGYSGASKTVTGVSIGGYDTTGITTGGNYVLSPLLNTTYKTKAYSDQLHDNLNKTVGFQLNIPIFNGLQTRTAITKAKIAQQNAAYNLQLTKNQLKKTIQKAYLDAKAALEKYAASKKTVKSMQESFKYTSEKFNVGMATSVEYNDAKNKLEKAQSDLLQAKYDYIFKIKVLDFYQGKPLGF